MMKQNLVLALSIATVIACDKPKTDDTAASKGEALTNAKVDGSAILPGSDLDTKPNPVTDNAAAPNAGAPPIAKEMTKLTFSDAQILKVADVANAGEVEEAKFAVTRLKNAEVKAFAQMMLDHHSEAKAKGQALAAKLKLVPTDSETATDLAKGGKKSLDSLKKEKDADFDESYVKDQIDEHEKVLALIDRELLPNAQNPEVKQLLNEMRPKVVMHLKTAQALKSKF